MSKLTNILPKGLTGPFFGLRADRVCLETDERDGCVDGSSLTVGGVESSNGRRGVAALGACLSELSGVTLRTRN